MTKNDLFTGIAERYAVSPDYPWRKLPDACVFRHRGNQKWFCLFMKVSAHCLGLEGKSVLSIINVKAPPEMIGSLRSIRGIFPAYHMNKEHWVSLVLNEVESEMLWNLVDESYQLTK